MMQAMSTKTALSKRTSALAALSLTLVFGLARAQDSESYDPDPPDRAARLSYVSGDVSLQPAGEQDWAPAITNRPMTTGDKLWTEQGARAEIYVGPAAIRLGDDTGFSFLNVDDDTIQMRMTAGVINVSVRYLDGNDHIEVDTPNVALSLLRPGNYRVEVNDAGDATVVKISEGEAEATGPGQNVIVHAQQSATFNGVDRLAANFGSLGAPDEFDSWSLERERRDDAASKSRTAQYVAPEVTGYEDLDDNGSWSNEPEYGYVWTPTRVAVDWSPYRYGRWVYVGPWGWTWVDDAPWGYAPFHYGRWAQVRNRWCWVPGPRHVRPVYAPALVGWVGSPGVSVSVTVGGGVGWFPLGPREVYVPARRFSPRYVERVNVRNTVIVNNTYITNVYNNRGGPQTYRNRGAITSVSQTTFTSSQRVGDHRVRLTDTEINRTRVTAAPPRIEPVRESHYGGPTRVNVRTPPKSVDDRQVVVRRPPPASNVHFARNTPVTHVNERGDAQTQRQQPTRTPTDRGGNFDNNRTRPETSDPVVRNRPDRPDRQRDNNGRDDNSRDDRQSGGTNLSTGPKPAPVREDRVRTERPVSGSNVPEQPSTPPAVSDQRGSNDRPRNDRPDRVQRREQPIDRQNDDRQSQAREQAQRQQVEQREQSQRMQSEQRAQAQRQESEQRAQAQRQQVEQREQAQRQQAEQRQQQQREQVQRQQQERPQPRQQESKPQRQERPAESKPPKQRDNDQPKPDRN